MIVAVTITLTTIVLIIGACSAIITTDTFKKFIEKKVERHKLLQIQRQQEAERLEQERLERERKEHEEFIKKQQRTREFLNKIAQEQKEKQERELLRKQAFEKRAREIEIENEIQDTIAKSNKILEDIDKTNPETTQKPKVENNKQSKNKKDFRLQNPATVRCLDGHWVRSKPEKRIADFCFYNRITYIYELEYHDKYHSYPFYPDFFFPDYNLYLEYFGKNDEKYLKKKYEKIEMFKNDININFEYIECKDEKNIETRLKEICRKYNIPLKGEIK